MERQRFPDFLCIGIQKCGTSWLDRCLRSHPDIWVPAIKELHYFNALYTREGPNHWAHRLRREFVVDSLKWHITQADPSNWNFDRLRELTHIANESVGDEWYGRIFGFAGSQQVCGELTPDYADISDRAVRHLLRLSPNVKLLISLRDPIDRSWSEIRMIAAERGLSSTDDLMNLAKSREVLARADYGRILRAWSAHVPKSRIFVTFLDHISTRPASVISALCRFLGVRDDVSLFGNLAEAVNPGEPQMLPTAVEDYLKEFLRPVYEELVDLYPEVASGWLARHYA